MSLNLKTILLSITILCSLPSSADHIVVDQWAYIPNVSVELVEDVHSGWNLKVNSTNFVFDAASAGSPHQIGHGHGHLYLNGKKVTRIYGEWTHIPGDWLNIGHNKVEVTLNANTHEELWYKNIVIGDSEMIYYSGGSGTGHNHDH